MPGITIKHQKVPGIVFQVFDSPDEPDQINYQVHYLERPETLNWLWADEDPGVKEKKRVRKPYVA